MKPMLPEQIQAACASLKDWQFQPPAIQRKYTFKDFAVAMAFVNQVAAEAEAVQHHPDILVRWNEVTLTFTTHDAGGLTANDFNGARRCDELATAAQRR